MTWNLLTEQLRLPTNNQYLFRKLEENKKIEMSDMHEISETTESYERPTYTRWLRFVPIVMLALLVLAGCAEGEAPPPAICDTYGRSLFTAQLIGGALLILALAVLGFKKQAAAIIPTQGAQVGAIAGTVFGGLILLAFSTEIGVQILTGFGLPDLFTLCGL